MKRNQNVRDHLANKAIQKDLKNTNLFVGEDLHVALNGVPNVTLVCGLHSHPKELLLAPYSHQIVVTTI